MDARHWPLVPQTVRWGGYSVRRRYRGKRTGWQFPSDSLLR
ncbi:hypothetical protein ABI_07000 [Asticcacaulis biprosthecium C19]|uniref:Uncharacterized protein n=1 Tax=Asticcacaulis biprosthecium C19 TaxID=715226 RepID=F4QLC1_9CAUL|nr:hypothetical protein ABI_07000 [Asticcacaulis biprosthecium C19]